MTNPNQDQNRFPGLPVFGPVRNQVFIPEVVPLEKKYLDLIERTIEKYGLDQSHGIDLFFSEPEKNYFHSISP